MTEIELNDYLYKYHRPLWLAINHHRTHKNKPMDFTGYPYLKAIFLDKSNDQSIIKSTQSGLSEYLTIKGIGKASQGRSVFHVLPTGGLRNRYVANRVNKSIQHTPYYYRLIQDSAEEKKYGGNSQSMSLKDVGPGVWAFVSSESEPSFTEFPADDSFIDEVDQCDQSIIPMADERLANSDDPTRTRISNPTVEGYGIDEHYQNSDQKKWFIKCPHCGKRFIPDWFKHVVREVGEGNYELRDEEFSFELDRDIMMMCEKCEKGILKGAEGDWVKKYPSLAKSGFQISKLFTTKTTLREMADRFSEGLIKPIVLQRFWNADLGQAFTADGAKITLNDIQGAVGTHKMSDKCKGYPVMGIDVGSLCNYVIGYVQPDKTCIVGEIGVLPTTASALAAKARQKGIKIIVIDARPEGFLVKSLKEIFPRTISCYYVDEAKKEVVDRYRNVSISRTTSLDSVKEGLVLGQFVLPVDWKKVPEFLEQMTAATRIFDPEAHKGQGAYKWTEGSKADHYHHAFNYLGIAKRLTGLLR